MSAISIYPIFLTGVILLLNYTGEGEKCVFMKIVEINENKNNSIKKHHFITANEWLILHTGIKHQ